MTSEDFFGLAAKNHSDVLGVRFFSDFIDLSDLNDFDFLCADSGMGGTGGIKMPGAGGVAPPCRSLGTCCRISGLFRIFVHGPAPVLLWSALLCLFSIRRLAKKAKKTIAAIPIIPRTIPIPAAAPLLSPPPLPLSDSSFVELAEDAVALPE